MFPNSGRCSSRQRIHAPTWKWSFPTSSLCLAFSFCVVVRCRNFDSSGRVTSGDNSVFCGSTVDTHVRVPVYGCFRQDLVPFLREGGLWILRLTLVVFMASEHGSPSRMCMFTRCGRLFMPHPGRQRCLRELTEQKSAFGVLHTGAGLWGGGGGRVHRAMASLISCIYWRVRRNSPSCHTSAQPPQRPTTTCVWDRTGCSPLRRGPEAGAHRNQTGGVLHDCCSCCGLVDAETGATPALVVATRGAALATVHHHRMWRRKP